MQEYRFKEGKYQFMVAWCGDGWIVGRYVQRESGLKETLYGYGGKFSDRDKAIYFAKTHYKVLTDLVYSGWL